MTVCAILGALVGLLAGASAYSLMRTASDADDAQELAQTARRERRP